MFTPQNGMAGMLAAALKNAGLDPEELRANVEEFLARMRDQAQQMRANQEALEAQGGIIIAKLDAMSLKLDEVLPIQTTREILEDGKATGVLITTERFPQAMMDEVNGGVSDGGA